jgi:hypothetical protein
MAFICDNLFNLRIYPCSIRAHLWLSTSLA